MKYLDIPIIPCLLGVNLWCRLWVETLNVWYGPDTYPRASCIEWQEVLLCLWSSRSLTTSINGGSLASKKIRRVSCVNADCQRTNLVLTLSHTPHLVHLLSAFSNRRILVTTKNTKIRVTKSIDASDYVVVLEALCVRLWGSSRSLLLPTELQPVTLLNEYRKQMRKILVRRAIKDHTIFPSLAR